MGLHFGFTMNPIQAAYFLGSFARGVAILLDLELGPLARAVEPSYQHGFW